MSLLQVQRESVAAPAVKRAARLTRPELSSTSSAALILVLAILAVHLPSLFLPYYFIDDLWLYRRPEAGFPNVYDTVVIQQGRPVFGVLAAATQALRSRLGIEAMLIVRAIAVMCVAAFAYCVYLFLRLWHTPRIALCLSVLLVTLPSFQMYVGAAPLFAPSLAYCGFVVFVFGRFLFREENTRRQLVVLLLSTMGLVFVWATYQAIPLVVVSLVTPLLLSESWESTPRWRRLGVFLAGVGVSLVAYYLAWRLANIGIPSDHPYSPKIRDLQILDHLRLYRTLRIPQIFSFWDTRSSAAPYLYECVALVAAAFAFDLACTKSKRLDRAAVWGLAAVAVVAVDFPVLLGPTTSNTFSYMTSAPGATAAFLLVACATVTVLRRAELRLPGLRRAAGSVAALLCAGAVALAARNVLVNQVVPNWLEYALVRAELRRYVTTGRGISSVTIVTRNSLLGQGRDEFHWANFGAAFWAHWAVRNILDELGANSFIRIDVVNSDRSVTTSTESLQAGELTPPESGQQVTIDLGSLDLSAPSGGILRQSALAAADAGSLPDGLALIPIDEIHSTLTFEGGGASGERAVIDGDARTSAADPRGFNAGTAMTLLFEGPREVVGLRVLTARQHGVTSAVTLGVNCDENGTSRKVGTIYIRAGMDVYSQAVWDAPCRTRTLRLGPSGPVLSGDFWIAEIQVLGRNPR